MNRERWLLLISLLLLAGTAAYRLRPQWFASTPGKGAVTVASKPSPAPASPQSVTPPSLPPVAVQSETIDEHTPWGRNPFLTVEEESGSTRNRASDGLQVKTIIVGRPKSVATIDGRTVTVGEKIGEETVTEIRPDAVVLERDGQKRLIKVSEPAISIEVKERKK